MYAGADWASEKHDVLIADETGEKLLAATFAHDAAGLQSLCRTLVRYKWWRWSRLRDRTGS
jgi:Transposase